jgi:hypothetical protein
VEVEGSVALVELETHSRWWKQRGRSHVNRVLRDDWNPIGWQVPEDEYAGYAGTVGRMLREGTSAVKDHAISPGVITRIPHL